MRILILGGDGMLGHRLLKQLSARHETRVTLRQNLDTYRAYGLFTPDNAYGDIDVRTTDRLSDVLNEFQPEAVVNCVGIVKQRSEAQSSIPSLEINALLPHRLANLTGACGARLLHLSTDCVFSGNRGNYREHDFADADDLYGRTKFLGEVAEPHCLTLRTSIIGRELARKAGLLEWFLAQRDKVAKGYRHAIFSGFTTHEMARIIERMLVDFPRATGLYQVSSEPISKYALLSKVNTTLGLGITLVPDDTFRCDRSLDSSRFRTEFDYRPPSWGEMVAELAQKF